MTSRTVHLDLGARAYDIHIGENLLREVGKIAGVRLEGHPAFIITDENVAETHAAALHKALQGSGTTTVHMLTLPAGERTKSFAQYERVLGWLLDNGVDRGSTLFAVGGGVIGDLGGFAAATVMRGIAFVQVPTTLLAQVDSAVGGKTGLNMPQGKNLVGAFYQPDAVICDLNTLRTLPRREILAGYAEILKYALINDAAFFEWLESGGAGALIEHEPEAVIKAVEMSCRKKADIVAADERESGARALLNLGHTFGHALEVVAGYDGRLLHGEAVAIGMVLAFRLSVRMGLCTQDDATRLEAHLAKVGLPTEISMIFPPLPGDSDAILAAMRRDKKADSGRIAFILARGIGEAFIERGVDMDDVRAVIDDSLKGL